VPWQACTFARIGFWRKISCTPQVNHPEGPQAQASTNTAWLVDKMCWCFSTPNGWLCHAVWALAFIGHDSCLQIARFFIPPQRDC